MTDFAFLHGGGQGGWVWDETIAAIAAQSGGAARCLALDAPGCGTKRGQDTSEIAFADISRELIADVEAEGMSDVVLVGHSQAGMTLPQMAEFAPGLFCKLVFVTCSMPLPGKSTLDQMGNSQHGEKEDEVGWPVDPDNTSMEDRFRAMFCNDMGEEQADAFLAKLGKDMWPACCYSYNDWRCDHLADMDVSFVLCLQDQALTPQFQVKFAHRLHADRIVRIEAGHQVMCTRPQGLAEILLAESAS
ncbi:MAG: alpha/beta hydrolase [Novosphingobium sp.]|nr:alpha/beta hydrolase [Novosphingobium sp.]